MAKRNVLIKKKNSKGWDELFPITTANNVKCANGKDVEKQLGDITTYQMAGGTATSINLNLPTLVNGYATTFIVSSNNNKNVTTINGKKLYKPNTATTPNLIAGKAVSVWYNSTKDCFFIKASAEGTATAEKVLAGETFSNDEEVCILGGMDLKAENIREGVTYAGIAGTLNPRILSVGNIQAVIDKSDERLPDTCYEKMLQRITVHETGSIRLSFSLKAFYTEQHVYGKIFKNGSAIGKERVTNSKYQYTTYTEDFLCNDGDYFDLYCYRQKGNMGGAVKEFSASISTNNLVTIG